MDREREKNTQRETRMKSIRSVPRLTWRLSKLLTERYEEGGEDEDARCLGGYISTISRVGGWKSPPRHSARKIVSGLTIHSHVPLPPPSLPASSVSRVFTRWIPVNIWHVRDAVDTSSSMHMRIVFFFPSLSPSLLFFSHNRTPRCHERGEFQRDRQICRRHVRARLIRFAANFRKLLDVWMSSVISIREIISAKR